MLSGKQILCIVHDCQNFFVVQPEIPVPVVITAYSDKTFTYVSNTPSIISITDSASGHCKVAQSLPATHGKAIMTYLTIHICNVSVNSFILHRMHAHFVSACPSNLPLSVSCSSHVDFLLNAGYENAASYIFYKASS